MSNWVSIIEAFRREKKLGSWGVIGESHYDQIAARCGPDELRELKQRLLDLDAAETEIPEWDGDASDDIWRARQMFTAILRYHGVDN